MELKDEVIILKEKMKGLQIELKETQGELKEVKGELKDVKELVDTLKAFIRYIEGHPADKKSSLFYRLDTMESTLEALSKTKAYISGNIAAIITLAGFFGWAIGALVKLYFEVIRK